MKSMLRILSAAAFLGLMACADWDNPTALDDMNPDVEFEINVARAETLEEVEIEVRATLAGKPMEMYRAELRMTTPSGTSRVVEMEQKPEGFSAHVRFYETGEYHLRFAGMPTGHRMMKEFGEHEMDVVRHRALIGQYWVEIELADGPILEGESGHMDLHVYELLSDGTRGALVSGLALGAEVHAPDGHETVVVAREEAPGEYEVEEFLFDEAGMYELHVEIDDGLATAEGEFHIPVLEPNAEDPVDGEEPGHGH